MHDLTPSHLSLDELDAWLEGALAPDRQAHIETCFECRTLTRAERVLVRRLDVMEHLSPSPGFADRVMAEVAIPDPFALRSAGRLWARITASRRTMALAASIIAVVGLSMGGSIWWSVSHHETLVSLESWVQTQAGSWFWVGLRGIVSNLLEHPWYDPVRQLLGTPGRIALVSAVNMMVYIGGVLLMKRLLASPGPRVAHAHS